MSASSSASAPTTPWSSFGIPQTVQKRLLKFLLKRSIGQFLEDELDLRNLDVQLGSGVVRLSDLVLDSEVSLMESEFILFMCGSCDDRFRFRYYSNCYYSNCCYCYLYHANDHHSSY